MNTILCLLGFHDWHKDAFVSFWHSTQMYGIKVCERCGKKALGFAKKNHPMFRKFMGIYSE